MNNNKPDTSLLLKLGAFAGGVAVAFSVLGLITTENPTEDKEYYSINDETESFSYYDNSSIEESYETSYDVTK